MPAPLRAPASMLAFLLEAHNLQAPSLFLVTGSSGAGKTSWCAAVVRLARAHSLPIGGLLSPAIMSGSDKIAIDLLDLSSGERRQLAQRLTLPARLSTHDPVTGHWRFDLATIAWGNRVLGKIAMDGLVIIDEMGPLEFEQQQGLQGGLHLVDTGRYRVACVTVRPALLHAARTRWPHAQVVAVGDESDD
ncbi:MAG: hypothetical protein GX579_08130 [Chloroflexi bacterium]|nr:hypothetical protein [Chloroflexota bacterium]